MSKGEVLINMGCTSSMRIAQDSDVNHMEGEGEGEFDNPAHGEGDTKSGGKKKPGKKTHSAEGTPQRKNGGTAAEMAEGPNGQVTPLLKMNSEEVYYPKDVRLHFNSIPIRPPPVSILLVFPKRNSQGEAFQKAAQSRGTDCLMVSSDTEALQAVKDKNFSIVVVDTRPGVETKDIHPEQLCQKLRGNEKTEFAVAVAVRPLSTGNKTDVQLPQLIAAGFSRQFLENTSVSVCAAELLCIELVDVITNYRLRLANALLTAVDNSDQPVEISNHETNEIQYINPAFERLVGYGQEEMIGRSADDFLSEDSEEQNLEAMKLQIKRGRTWEGICQMRKKDGERVTQKTKVIPVRSYSGKTHHVVSLRCPGYGLTDISNGSIAGMVSPNSGNRARKESIVRLKSMSIETPLSKVIFMVSNLRDHSSEERAEALDKILDVLRSSELHHPILSSQVKDKTTQDLVGGLMNTMEEETPASHSRRVSNAKRRSTDSEFLALKHNKGLSPVNEQHAVSLVDREINPEVEKLLETEPQWNFDILALERLTNKSPLLHLAMRTLNRFEVMEFLMIEDKVMAAWLTLIESNYQAANPYHNSTHAADVMHATSYFLGCDKVKNLFDQEDEAAALLSAIVHDLDHPGKTNSFLINAAADVALLYNDLAVLESHHVSTAYRLTLKSDSCNIFRNLPRDDYKHLRQQIVDMVLATEMTKHFEHLNRFVTVVDQSDEQLAVGNHSAEAKTLIKRMLIKCADVSNPARPLAMCKEWAWRIAKEYCNQTDEEKARGLPVVMPVFDRKSCNIPKSQIGFIDLFIKDMFTAWKNFCGFNEMMHCVDTNYAYWKEQEIELAKSGGVSDL